MCANDPYTSSCKRKTPLLSVCLCFTPLEAERCASVASSPSLWPGGAPLSPGRSVFMPLASSNPPRQCMEPAPTQRQSGRAAEPPPEPSPSHVPRCERAISPTYAAKPGLTCTAACRFLCRTASDQARRASGRWPKGASEPPASFRGAGRPELCQSRFNSERQPMCCKNAGLAVPARSGGAFRGGDKARTGITPRRSSGRSVGRDRRPPKTAKPTFLQHIVWRSRAAEHCRAVGRAAWTRIDSHDNLKAAPARRAASPTSIIAGGENRLPPPTPNRAAVFVMGAILRPTRPRPAEPAGRETTAEGRAAASLSANGIPTASLDAHKHFT